MWVPDPRMGGRKGEAGVSPALSRNCNPHLRRARTTAQIATTKAFVERGWSDEPDNPLSRWQGSLFGRMLISRKMT